ncbi:hypothetical protein KJ966_27515 [bacterium]|nr:hypothetical protein [bacterium]
MNPVHREQDPKIFIALEAEQPDQQILQCLTTEVMQWTETVWIMNISPYYSYWLKQSCRTGSTPISLWRKLFNHLLGEEPREGQSKVISLSPAYRAACARNPWSAVLLLNVMRRREINGLISQNSKFGASLFREISWETWWQEIENSETLFSNAKIKGFKRLGFKQQCKRLKMASPRLGLKFPRDMSILNYNGVKKRFGETLAKIWDWTYGVSQNSRETIYQTGFPWQAFKFSSPPVVERHPDYPLLVWEQFVPLLTEDFDKLARIRRNSGERVIRIDWKLRFDDMRCLEIPICFRNPHNLQKEVGEHHTALLQANYGFIELMNEKFPADPQNGSNDLMPTVLGWKLEIFASLCLPDIVLDIFGESQEKDTELEILHKLENELPVSISRYIPKNDWLPEDSFFEEHFQEEEVVVPDSEINRSLEAVAESRPLYIRRNPLAIRAINQPRVKDFLESTMTKWWKEEKHPGKERHYFKHIDPEGNSTWVFQDTAGNWYQHGIFG